MARILVHTLGSSGDFNPYIALALELQARGHTIQFAVNPEWAAKLRALGFDAVDVGPDPSWQGELLTRKIAEAKQTPRELPYIETTIAAIRPATEALEPLCRRADLLVCITFQFAGYAVAHRTGVPWVSVLPYTAMYPNEELPPIPVAWNRPPAALCRLWWTAARWQCQHFDALADEEFRALGVPPLKDVYVGGTFSRRLTLGLWSPSYQPRPKGWPSWLQVGGYARWDAPAPEGMKPISLPPGDAPLVVFTLGSLFVNDPRGFYDMALEAIAPTDWRAVLLGAPPHLAVPEALQGRVTLASYARYADLFPQADAVVHHAGLGTTQAACYYGVPALAVPYDYDQFENAAHVQRNGWGLRLPTSRLTPAALRSRLTRLLGSPGFKRRAAALSKRMQAEPGPARSADLLEAAL